MNTIGPMKRNSRMSFGMRYKDPKKWGEKTLQTFMDSELRKDIDKKYPDAIASYKVTKRRISGFFERKEYSNKLDFKLKLSKDKVWNYRNTTLNSSELLDDVFAKKLKQSSLDNIEQDIAKIASAEAKHEEYIRLAKEENRKNSFGYMSIFKFWK